MMQTIVSEFYIKMYVIFLLVPSSGPETVGALATTSTSIEVTWGEVPAHHKNGRILGYKVEINSHRQIYLFIIY